MSLGSGTGVEATLDYDDTATGGDEPSDKQMTHRERDINREGGTRGEREGPGESEGNKERGGIPGRKPEGEVSVSVGTVIIFEMTANDSSIC